MELRSGAQTMPNDEASIAAEARSLIDWNTRNKVRFDVSLLLSLSPFLLRARADALEPRRSTRSQFCPACARPIRSVWAGWKRCCIPGELGSSGADGEAGSADQPPCFSRKGVHNFSYPRTDPVVISACSSSSLSRSPRSRFQGAPGRR